MDDDIRIVKRITGLSVIRSGWKKRREVKVDLTIRADKERERFYFVRIAQDGSFQESSWHQTLDDAERAAEKHYGVRPDQWTADY
jgi:hypothetical protein